jgi:hypothetical protein
MNLLPKVDVFKDFSRVVPYRAITNDCIVLSKPDRLTAVLEMHISSTDNLETMQYWHDRLMKVFLEMPANTTVSIYYVKTFHKPNIPIVATHKDEIVNYIEKVRVKHLSSITSFLHQNYLSITLPIEQEKSEFGLVDKVFGNNSSKVTEKDLKKVTDSFKKTLEKINDITKTIINGMEGTIYRLTSSQILQFLSLLCNHDFVDYYSSLSSIFKGDFNCTNGGLTNSASPGYVYYGGNYHAVMSQRSIDKKSKLPEKSHAGMNQIFNHRDLKEIPFIIQHSISFIPKQEGISKASVRKGMIAGVQNITKVFPLPESWLKTPEGINPEILRDLIENAIEEVKNSEHRFLEQHFHVHLWNNSLNKLNETIRTFENAVSTTYKLKRDKYNIKAAYYSIFPGNEKINPIKSMIPSFNVADFMPIDMPRFCYPQEQSKNFIYYHNSVDSLTKIDPFDRRADVWNALIIGGPGSGKSFLAQDILWQYMIYNPQIAIIDRGGAECGSYRSFVMNNRGTYLELNFTSESDFSVNPFDGPLFVRIEKDEKGREVIIPDMDGKPDPLKSISLLATIERMVCEEGKNEISGNIKAQVFALLRTYYTKKNNNLDNSCNLNEFAQNYLKDNTTLINSGRDLYKELFYFIGEGVEEGPYARFFRATKKIKNKDVVCFDLQGISSHPKLKDVLVPALLEMIATNIISDQKSNRRKFVFVDEAWADLKGGSNVGSFMEELARTIRKMNGQITVISQRFSDILDSPIGGPLIQCTSYYYFVGSKHEPEPLRNAVATAQGGRKELSSFDIEQIITQKSKQEFYLLTPFFCGKLRLYPSKEFAMVATTDSQDKAVLRKYQNILGYDYVTPEVMAAAKEELFNT